MKLKSLWISKYKNIENLKLEFKAGNISLLVGRNGLGKSNLIEVLALIFRDLDLIETVEEFENWVYNNFEYELLYKFKEWEILVSCREGTAFVQRRNEKENSKFESVTFSFLTKHRGDFIPRIIGYYSGENKRIKEIIRPYEEKVWSELKQNKGLDQSFRKIFFAENHHAKIVLLTLLLYKEQNENKEFKNRINELIRDYTSFSVLHQFSLKLHNPSWYNPNNETHQQQGVNQLIENFIGRDRRPFPFWNAKGKADKVLSFFYNYSQEEPIIDLQESPSNKIEKELLELNSIDYHSAAENVFNEFGHPLRFFDAFESLITIDVISNILLEVKGDKQDTSFDFTQLSEGEQQLITVLGLILITGQDNCLYLLDEPDTHLNPLWQRDYVKLLNDFDLNNDNSHIVIATHSPLIVQAAENADIFLYRRNEEGEIVVDNNEDYKIHNWRIDQVLASEYFQFPNTRPPQLDQFMMQREELLSKPVLTEEDIKLLEEYEEAENLLPSGETLNDFLAMHLIRKTASKVENDQDK